MHMFNLPASLREGKLKAGNPWQALETAMIRCFSIIDMQATCGKLAAMSLMTIGLWLSGVAVCG